MMHGNSNIKYSAQHSSFPSLDALFFRPYFSVSFVFRILCSCGLLVHNTLCGSTTQRVSHCRAGPSNSLLSWIIHYFHSVYHSRYYRQKILTLYAARECRRFLL